jgi:hypothetical protein
MERSEIWDVSHAVAPPPDYAALHPGYMPHPAAIFSARWNAGRATQRSI